MILTTLIQAAATLSAASNFSAPNFVLLLTDDQDVRLGSMQAMPTTRDVLVNHGATRHIQQARCGLHPRQHGRIEQPARLIRQWAREDHVVRSRRLAPQVGGSGRQQCHTRTRACACARARARERRGPIDQIGERLAVLREWRFEAHAKWPASCSPSR